MWTTLAGLSQVANCAGIQCAGMSLQVDEFDRIERFGAGADGMGAILTFFAVKTTVTPGDAVQSLVLTVSGVVMASIAAGLVQPGVGVFFYLLHTAVAVSALHAVLAGHDIS